MQWNAQDRRRPGNAHKTADINNNHIYPVKAVYPLNRSNHISEEIKQTGKTYMFACVVRAKFMSES